MSSDPATGIEHTGAALPWLCALLQTSDSFYPTGSYAHSFGLEGLVNANVIRDAATLGTFLEQSALPLLRQVDLPLVAHAHRALAGGDWRLVQELAVLSSALKTAKEARAASEAIGRQRADLMAKLHPHSIAPEYTRRSAADGWPHASTLSAALESQCIGAPVAAALCGYAYSAIMALIAAAMKLLRLGQNQAQALLSATLAAMPGVIAAAHTVAVDAIGWFNPWLDIAAARHEVADARMFIS